MRKKYMLSWKKPCTNDSPGPSYRLPPAPSPATSPKGTARIRPISTMRRKLQSTILYANRQAEGPPRLRTSTTAHRCTSRHTNINNLVRRSSPSAEISSRGYCDSTEPQLWGSWGWGPPRSSDGAPVGQDSSLFITRVVCNGSIKKSISIYCRCRWERTAFLCGWKEVLPTERLWAALWQTPATCSGESCGFPSCSHVLPLHLLHPQLPRQSAPLLSPPPAPQCSEFNTDSFASPETSLLV